MAYEIPGELITLEASTGLSDKQFRFVVATAGKATLAGNGVPVLGVLQNKPAAGEGATVMINGVSKVVAHGSTLAAGDLIASSSVGMVAAAAAGEYTVGRILFGSSGSTGRILTVNLEPIGTT